MSTIPKRTRWLAAAVGVFAIGVASLAVADSMDTGAPKTIVVGSPEGHAVSERIDPARRGQTTTVFPTAPTELWRRELAGGLNQPPVVDADGEVIAALVTPDVVRIGADGRQQWRTKISAPAAVPPVLTSDASTFIVGQDATAWSISKRGAVRFTAELGFRTKGALAAPVALDNGEVAMAGERHLAIMGADGEIRALAELPSTPVGALIRYRRGILASTRRGDIFHWRSPTRPKKLGSLGGSLDGGVMLVTKRAVMGVVNNERVAVLDLKSGLTSLVIGQSSTLVRLDGPPTLALDGNLLITSVIGELFSVDAHGVVQQRLALEPLPVLFGADGGPPTRNALRRLNTRPHPPLIVDPNGDVGFIRNSGKIGIVRQDGSLTTVTRRLCARPLALLPAGPRRLIAACRSGSVAVYADAAAPDAGPPDAVAPGATNPG